MPSAATSVAVRRSPTSPCRSIGGSTIGPGPSSAPSFPSPPPSHDRRRDRPPHGPGPPPRGRGGGPGWGNLDAGGFYAAGVPSCSSGVASGATMNWDNAANASSGVIGASKAAGKGETPLRNRK